MRLTSTYNFLFLAYVKCNILLTHTYEKMLASGYKIYIIFTEYKLKAFYKNLIHQRISQTTFFLQRYMQFMFLMMQAYKKNAYISSAVYKIKSKSI